MGIYEKLKELMQKIFPAYRVSLRLEDELHELNRMYELYKQLNRRMDMLSNQVKAAENRMEAMFWLLNTEPGETVEQTKWRVFMDMPVWNANIAMLQKGSGYLLRRMRQICLEKDIPFWLLGGTLLGAVRHKGFIPWDDDIDVGMMREDIERFQEAVKEYPDLKFDRYFSVPVRREACYVMRLTLADARAPFWVDVLCYDYAGDPSKDEEELWQEINQCRFRMLAELAELMPRMKRVYGNLSDDEDRKLVEQIYLKGRAALPPVTSRDYIYRSIDCVCGAWQQLFPCERIMPFTQLEFEGDLYHVPKDYEWQLGLQYGDYMTIPESVGKMHNSGPLKARLKYGELFLKELGLE